MPNTLEDLDDSLSVTEAADILHIDRATLYRVIGQGDLKVVHVGSGRGRMRITRRALTEYINRPHQVAS